MGCGNRFKVKIGHRIIFLDLCRVLLLHGLRVLPRELDRPDVLHFVPRKKMFPQEFPVVDLEEKLFLWPCLFYGYFPFKQAKVQSRKQESMPSKGRGRKSLFFGDQLYHCGKYLRMLCTFSDGCHFSRVLNFRIDKNDSLFSPEN